MKKTIVTLKKLTRTRLITSTKTTSVAASSGPTRAKRDYVNEPIELPSEEVLPLEDDIWQGRDTEPNEAADFEDEERPEEQRDLEARQARNLCPPCPVGAVMSAGKTNSDDGIVYCCPLVKVSFA